MSFISTLLSIGQTVGYYTPSISLSPQEKREVVLGSHPLAELYEATADSYPLLKRKIKVECQEEWEALVSLKKSLKDEIPDKLQRSRKAIDQLVANRIGLLSQDMLNMLYYNIYDWVRPWTTDTEWGKKQAEKDTPLVINALYYKAILKKSPPLVVNVQIKEAYLAEANRSRFYETEGKLYPYNEKGKPLRRIGYINGIGTSFGLAQSDAKRIAEDVCQNYMLFNAYNTSHGFLADIAHSLQLQKNKISEPVLMLLQRWNEFFACAPKEACFLQICFSQGCCVTDVALRLLPRELKKRLCIIAIAPGSIIEDNDVQIRHVVKLEDFSCAIAKGRERIKQRDPSIIIVENDPGFDPHDPHGPSYSRSIAPLVNSYLDNGKIF